MLRHLHALARSPAKSRAGSAERRERHGVAAAPCCSPRGARKPPRADGRTPSRTRPWRERHFRPVLRIATAATVLSLALVAAAPRRRLRRRVTATPSRCSPRTSRASRRRPTRTSERLGARPQRDEPVVGRRQRERQDDDLQRRRRLQSIGGQPFQTVEGRSDRRRVLRDRRPVPGGDDGDADDARHVELRLRNEDGEIRAWRGGSTAALVTVPNTTGAVYKGLAISNSPTLGAAALCDRLPQRARRRLRRLVAHGQRPPARSSTHT